MTATHYSLNDYAQMLAGDARLRAYAEALRAVVRPGCSVLDLGSGPGIFALLAGRLGAGSVHALEPGPSITLARGLAAHNGLGDRIRFHRVASTDWQPPAQFDVVVSDLRGTLPPFGEHIESVVDARERLLLPGGTLIGRRDVLFAALVEDIGNYRRYDRIPVADEFGLDLSPARTPILNTWHKVHLCSPALLVEPQSWASLDYSTVASPSVHGRIRWQAAAGGTARGLLLWFDAELAEGIGFSNAPGGPGLCYGQGFFPLSQPVDIRPGDAIHVVLRADKVGNRHVWQWHTRVTGAHAGVVKADFRQSTFHGELPDPEHLRRCALDSRPALDMHGRIDRWILTAMDGSTSIADIASGAMRAFPEQLGDEATALARIRGLLRLYSR